MELLFAKDQAPNGITNVGEITFSAISHRKKIEHPRGVFRRVFIGSSRENVSESFEAKSRATVSYPIPSGPEGSSGQYRCSVIRISLASFFFLHATEATLLQYSR